ncbi:MAG: hypothetical protein MI742_01890 [Desulfobacterales bacterium]|nr:hypothetical protein [Desulfobacterales bacterium]
MGFGIGADEAEGWSEAAGVEVMRGSPLLAAVQVVDRHEKESEAAFLLEPLQEVFRTAHTFPVEMKVASDPSCMIYTAISQA